MGDVVALGVCGRTAPPALRELVREGPRLLTGVGGWSVSDHLVFLSVPHSRPVAVDWSHLI